MTPHRLRMIRVGVLKMHRRLGMVIALFAIFLTVTGVLINHSHGLGFDSHRLNNRFLLQFYGVSPAAVKQGFNVGDHWLVQVGSELYFDEHSLGHCLVLSGAVTTPEGGAALCADGLMLFTLQGDLIEKLSLAGLPLLGLGRGGDVVVSRVGQEVFHLDMSTGEWLQIGALAATPQWSIPAAMPGKLAETLREQNVPVELTVERLLLDLHSGRLFGRVGVGVIDAAALLLMVLAISGVWVFLVRHRG